MSYVDDSPEDAQRIVNRLVQVFVEENSKSREIRAQDTSQFIEGQLRSSEARLATLEARLRQTKESYMGRLPEQTNANLAMVSALQQQLESNATATRGEQDRLSILERQIEAMQQGADEALAGLKGGPGEPAQSRAMALRGELAEAQLTFTDKHPEVIRLREELANAEKAAAAERARPVSDRMAFLNANPEYRQLLKDRETDETAHRGAAARSRRPSARRSAAIDRASKRRRASNSRWSRCSASTTSSARRTAELTQKKQAALLNEEIQRKQGAEQFAVLVPAGLPSEPFKPKPMRVLLMALAAGLVLGAAGVAGRDYLDRSVHDARGLRAEFELPVLAEIPGSNQSRDWARRRLREQPSGLQRGSVRATR